MDEGAGGQFQAVRCPQCRAVVAEIMTGLVRVQCRSCKSRVWIAARDGRVKVAMVDVVSRRIAQSA